MRSRDAVDFLPENFDRRNNDYGIDNDVTDDAVLLEDRNYSLIVLCIWPGQLLTRDKSLSITLDKDLPYFLWFVLLQFIAKAVVTDRKSPYYKKGS